MPMAGANFRARAPRNEGKGPRPAPGGAMRAAVGDGDAAMVPGGRKSSGRKVCRATAGLRTAERPTADLEATRTVRARGFLGQGIVEGKDGYRKTQRGIDGKAKERSRDELIGVEHKGNTMQRCEPRGLRYNGFDKN